MPHYHNTNGEKDATLKESERKAVSQEGDIKFLFQCFPLRADKGFTADEITAEYFQFSKIPITSIRRSLTNLTSDKWGHFLIKSDEMRLGHYWKLTHVYKINPNPTTPKEKKSKRDRVKELKEWVDSCDVYVYQPDLLNKIDEIFK